MVAKRQQTTSEIIVGPDDLIENGEMSISSLNKIEEIEQPGIPKDVLDLFSKNASTASQAEALAIISSGKVPEKAISTHPGKGGQIFSYVDHAWITSLLRSAFGPYVNFIAHDAMIEEDGSATAKAEISVYIPQTNYTYRVIEHGSCKNIPGMALADRKLSATSRAFARCAFRGFGIGQQFYKTRGVEEWTNEESWTRLMVYVAENLAYINQNDVVEFCKQNNIKNNEITAKFKDIWNFIGKTVSARRQQEKINKLTSQNQQASSSKPKEVNDGSSTTEKPTAK